MMMIRRHHATHSLLDGAAEYTEDGTLYKQNIGVNNSLIISTENFTPGSSGVIKTKNPNRLTIYSVHYVLDISQVEVNQRQLHWSQSDTMSVL